MGKVLLFRKDCVATKVSAVESKSAISPDESLRENNAFVPSALRTPNVPCPKLLRFRSTTRPAAGSHSKMPLKKVVDPTNKTLPLDRTIGEPGDTNSGEQAEHGGCASGSTLRCTICRDAVSIQAIC